MALPPRPRASLREWTLRGFAAGAGVVDVGMDGAYDVVSHNWPRTDRPRRCHAGVLGIWWELWEQMLPQIETVIAIAAQAGRPVWVDYLSIDQDSTQDKQALMQKMGHIYSRATQGYVDCTRVPDVATIDPRDVVALLAGANTDTQRRVSLRRVAEAPYFSRCWTFQEALVTPSLDFFDPARAASVGSFAQLRDRCLQEFRRMHSSGGYETAKREGWFTKAASIISYIEMIDGNVTWNLGRVLNARGRRESTEECDQLNSLLGILDVKCGYTGLPTARTLDEPAFRALVEACARNGDTSFLAGEDPTIDNSALSWAPSSPYAEFTTQAEAGSVGWVRMTNDGPELQFHRSYPVVDVIRISADPDTTLARIVADDVSGAWLAEYCGISFGAVMDDPLPIAAAEIMRIFADRSRPVAEITAELGSLLPAGARWRAAELANYLTGIGGRFTAWIVCQSPTRRVAFMAKLVTGAEPREVLAGIPAPSTYRATHSYVPLVAVDGEPVPRRVGWVWPCVHATLDPAEAEPAECIRTIRQ